MIKALRFLPLEINLQEKLILNIGKSFHYVSSKSFMELIIESENKKIKLNVLNYNISKIVDEIFV